MARTYFSARSAAGGTTTSTSVWQNCVSLNPTLEASTDYWVIWSGDFRVSVTSSDVQVQVYDGTSTYDTINLEPNDTSPNEYFSCGGFFKYTSGSAGAVNFRVQVKAEAASTVTGRNAQLVIIKAISTDQWVETTGSSATSTTEQTKQTLTWTPDQQRDYIVLGTVTAAGASTTAGMIIRLKDPSVATQSTSYAALNDGTNVTSMIVADYAAALAASSQSYTLTTQDVGASGGAVTNRRILALDVTGENVFENTAADGPTNNTGSYVDEVTFSPTIANTTEHLVFACGGMHANSTTVSGYVDVTIAGSEVAETVCESSNTSNMIFGVTVAWVGSLTAGTVDFKTRAKNESGSVVVGSRQTKFVVWDIQTGVASPGAISGTTTLTFSQAGDLKGSGALAGTSTLTFAPAGNLIGEAPISGTTSLTFTPTATGTAIAAAEGTTLLTFAPSGTLAGSGALAGTAALSFTPSATLTGDGVLAGTAALTFSPSATLTGDGALAGTTALAFTPSATLTGDGALEGTTSLTFTPTGTLDLPSGAISGTADLTFALSGTLAGDGALVGASDLTFAAMGTLTGTGAAAIAAVAPEQLGGSGWSSHEFARLRRRKKRAEKQAIEIIAEIRTAEAVEDEPPDDTPPPMAPIASPLLAEMDAAISAIRVAQTLDALRSAERRIEAIRQQIEDDEDDAILLLAA